MGAGAPLDMKCQAARVCDANPMGFRKQGSYWLHLGITEYLQDNVITKYLSRILGSHWPKQQ